jgi:hypothetical protein
MESSDNMIGKVEATENSATITGSLVHSVEVVIVVLTIALLSAGYLIMGALQNIVCQKTPQQHVTHVWPRHRERIKWVIRAWGHVV